MNYVPPAANAANTTDLTPDLTLATPTPKKRPFAKFYCDDDLVFQLPPIAFKIWMLHFKMTGLKAGSYPSRAFICQTLDIGLSALEDNRKWLVENGWLKLVGYLPNKAGKDFAKPMYKAVKGTLPAKPFVVAPPRKKSVPNTPPHGEKHCVGEMVTHGEKHCVGEMVTHGEKHCVHTVKNTACNDVKNTAYTGGKTLRGTEEKTIPTYLQSGGSSDSQKKEEDTVNEIHHKEESLKEGNPQTLFIDSPPMTSIHDIPPAMPTKGIHTGEPKIVHTKWIPFDHDDIDWTKIVPPGEVTWFIGDGSMSKTTMAIDMCARVSSETDRKYYLASAEDDRETTLKPRLKAAGAHPYGSIIDTKVYGDAGHMDLVSYDLRAHFEWMKKLKVGIFILDPLSNFLAPDESLKPQERAKVIGRVLTDLKALAKEFGIAVILTAHLNSRARWEYDAFEVAGFGNVRDHLDYGWKFTPMDIDYHFQMMPLTVEMGKPRHFRTVGEPQHLISIEWLRGEVKKLAKEQEAACV